MTTNYDPIAEQYKRSKQQPWRTHIEASSLMALIGDPSGKSIGRSRRVGIASRDIGILRPQPPADGPAKKETPGI
jgi:hypothetical protein